jgi:hypothetical protein
MREYKRLRRLMEFGKRLYAHPELRRYTVERAKWAKERLYEGSTAPMPERPKVVYKWQKRAVKPKPVSVPCFQCGLRLLENDKKCPRCGWTNK